MTENKETKNFDNGTLNSPKGHAANVLKPTRDLFLWLLHFSLFALVVFAVGVFFQIQLIALREELSTLRLNFSSCDEETSRNLRKRSSSDYEDVGAGGGIQAAHLQGSFPFQHVLKEGKIGPWSASTSNNTFLSLKKKNMEIEISQNGIYYVYAQVYYLTSELHNSFQILSYNGTEERTYHRNLVTCSSPGRKSMGEVSCYTGFTRSFRQGQRLYLNQVEQNRIIHFANGCSFFGVVLLKGNADLKPIK